MKREILFISYYFVAHFAIAVKDDISVVDSRLDKIEELDLPELINVSLSSDLGYHHANILYKWKFGDKPVEITYVPEGQSFIFNDRDKIVISTNTAETYLKAFGESIETLKLFYYAIAKDELKEIGRLYNNYCSETLTEFRAHFLKEGSFADMEKPFNKVERVELDGRWRTLKENSLSPDKLFPKLRSLDLTYWNGTIIFEHHYPYLEEFKTDVPSSEAFIKFIKRNPQIKKLYLQAPSTSVELLETINDNLLQLDVLEFHWPNDFLSYEEPVIQLNYVKQALIRHNDIHTRSGDIRFEQLESLDVTINGELDNTWINFIATNKQLKSLTAGKFNDSTLLAFPSNLDSLIEVNLCFGSDVTVEAIVKFLEGNSHLKRITLDLNKASVQFFASLTQKLENKYNVTPINKSFNKINLINLATTSESDANIQISTETISQNTTVSENNSDNSASNGFSNIFLTAVLMAIVVHEIVTF